MAKDFKEIILYQAKSGQIEFRGDISSDTIWSSQKQMAELFEVDVRTINEHLKNIFKSNELQETSTIRKFRIVQKEASRDVERELNHYNLDAILSVGYRVNSKQATEFRIWATKVLKQHLIDGYTINKKRISKNYKQFLEAVNTVKKLIPKDSNLASSDVLELVNLFAHNWFSLDAFDRDAFPLSGTNKKKIKITSSELGNALNELKKQLVSKKQASDLFGKDRSSNSLESIVGNVFQSFGGKELYPTIEEKASHILYFIIKNHPFVDGNKRSGAFAFIWFLQQACILPIGITPEALTAITLLIAESNPKEKDRMIGLILLLLS